MFSLNELLNTCFIQGYYSLYVEEGVLPLFMPVNNLFSRFSIYTQRDSKYCDSVLPIDSDFFSTCLSLVNKTYHTGKHAFYVHKHSKGVIFRHLLDTSYIVGEELSKLFGSKKLEAGMHFLMSDDFLSGKIAVYKYMEYLDSEKFLFNTLEFNKILHYTPTRSKVNYIELKELNDLTFLNGLISGVLVLSSWSRNAEFLEFLAGVSTHIPVIAFGTEKDLSILQSNKVFFSKIIELDTKEKLHIRKKQDTIKVRLDVTKLLKVIKRGKDASI